MRAQLACGAFPFPLQFTPLSLPLPLLLPFSLIELWPWFVLERAARTQIKTVWRLAPATAPAASLAPALLLPLLLLPEWRDNQRRRAIFNTFCQDTYNILFCCVRTSACLSLPLPLPCSFLLLPPASSSWTCFLLRQCSGCSFCLVSHFFRSFFLPFCLLY